MGSTVRSEEQDEKRIPFPAHIAADGRVESVAEHLRRTAERCAAALESVGLTETGYLCGLLHDMGKLTAAFSAYLGRAARGEPVVRGSVNHTFCAVVFLFERYHQQGDFDAAVCEIIAYAVGAHHGQFDCVNAQEDGFLHRLTKPRTEIGYAEAVANFFATCADEKEVERRFRAASRELTACLQTLAADRGARDFAFAAGVVARLVLSALIEGDWGCTADFLQNRRPPRLPADRRAYWRERQNDLEAYLSRLKPRSPIDRARREISDRCCDFAKRAPGIYRLSVPTGSGKTLSALRYAVAHAARYAKKRIFYLAPLLTVLDQNAAVIRRALFSAGGDETQVLEHSSEILASIEDGAELNEYQLLTENWCAPVVVTTLVQFLNTLFLGKSSSVRRMHALTDSVIIIDEIQSLPLKTVALFNQAMNVLTQMGRTTVILCSATQPCFEETGLHPLRLSEPTELVPPESDLLEAFRRTRIVDRCTPYGYSLEEMEDFVSGLAEKNPSVLVVCNTKGTAAGLLQKLFLRFRRELAAGEMTLFHLSAAMCKKHRAAVLATVEEGLRAQRRGGQSRLICVSTQLVEAGVDLSFSCVVRLLAGLDSIAQAAGRCNRSGEYGSVCEVSVINAQESVEQLRFLPDIREAKTAARKVLCGHPDDLLSAEAVRDYYRCLFAARRGIEEYPLPRPQSQTLFTLLSEPPEEPEFDAHKAFFLRQSFRTAGAVFSVFDEESIDVIVAYDDEASELIAALYSERSRRDLGYREQLLRRAKVYTVAVYFPQLERLAALGAVRKADEDFPFYTLDQSMYDSVVGVMTDPLQSFQGGL